MVIKYNDDETIEDEGFDSGAFIMVFSFILALFGIPSAIYVVWIYVIQPHMPELSRLLVNLLNSLG